MSRRGKFRADNPRFEAFARPPGYFADLVDMDPESHTPEERAARQRNITEEENRAKLAAEPPPATLAELAEEGVLMLNREIRRLRLYSDEVFLANAPMDEIRWTRLCEAMRIVKALTAKGGPGEETPDFTKMSDEQLAAYERSRTR